MTATFAIAGAVLSAISPVAGVILALCLTLALVALVSASAHFLATVGMLLILGSAAGPAIPISAGLGTLAMRILGAVLIILTGMAFGSRTQNSRSDYRHFGMLIVLGLGLYALVGSLAHDEAVIFAALTVSILLLALYLSSVTYRIPVDVLRSAVVVSLALFIGASLLCGLFAPAVGVEQGRLRGLAENANGLACFAFVFGTIALTAMKRRACMLLSLTLSPDAPPVIVVPCS